MTQVAVAIAKAVVVGCIDPRTQKDLNHLRRLYDLNGCTSAPLHVAGPSLNIAAVFRSLDVAVNKLGAREIHVVDHEVPECAGYTAAYGDNYPKGLHRHHLRAVRTVLRERYPGIEVHIHILRVPGGHEEII